MWNILLKNVNTCFLGFESKAQEIHVGAHSEEQLPGGGRKKAEVGFYLLTCSPAPVVSKWHCPQMGPGTYFGRVMQHAFQ